MMLTITQTISKIDKIDMFCKLAQIVSEGDYHTGDWWCFGQDETTGEDAYLACPITRLQQWYLTDFDTEELGDDVF